MSTFTPPCFSSNCYQSRFSCQLLLILRPPTCLAVCLPAYPSACYMPVCLMPASYPTSAYLTAGQSVCLSVCLLSAPYFSTYLPVSVLVCLPSCQAVCLPAASFLQINLSAWLPLRLFVCLSECLLGCLSVCKSLCQSA